MSGNNNVDTFNSITFNFESESKSLLIKKDDPFMKITIEDDSNDVFMKYEPHDFDVNLYGKAYNPFVCPICSYEAGGSFSFQLHTMSHSKRNFYACKNYGCNYTATIEELVQHVLKDHAIPESSFKEELTSSGDGLNDKKFWVCDLCGYKTISNSNMRLHLKSH
ncbi:hypothetical protein RN001_010769 [Aquatica leii]|uniref:C2H2-type domain-containing protein n=1 Tax=Aquatica leii TaxID=1421715 RepID=A0AAN7SNF4_9COLE|nr:hypothetical protein RN001_010769 [Aquatica leii]